MIFPIYKKIQILVVDDSAFMRSAIKGMISKDPMLEVIATARDGQEAIEKIEKLKPDIVTLDLEMPRMDGITALKIIMERMPLPVLIISSLTTEGADATFEALNLGAVDFVCKDLQSRSMNIMNIEDMLITKIKEIVRNRTEASSTHHPKLPVVASPLQPKETVLGTHNVAIVSIGVSTGGPKALQEIIPLFPKDFLVPILIVQHMPVLFTKPFADRLNSISQLEVKEAEEGDMVEPGKVFIARGGIHMKVKKIKPFEVRIELNPNPSNILYRPSVNVMMSSVVEVYGGRSLGVIMTGMGNDGTEGMRAIKYSGGKTIVQNEETCVVYGMPKSVVDDGLADKVVSLSHLVNEIINMV